MHRSELLTATKRAFLSPVTPHPTAMPGSDKPIELAKVDVQVAGNHPQLHADVAASYTAWRAEVAQQSGYDVLGRVSDMFRSLGYSSHPYGHLSWHRTGRAVDLLFEWHAPEEKQDLINGPNRLLVIREDLGAQTYWRLYLHCRDQDGTMGEPLTVARHVADLHDVVLAVCDGQSPALVGESWGAMLALAYAAEHPRDVGPIVLVA